MASTLDRSPDASLRRIGVTYETVIRRILRTFDKATPHQIEQGSTWYDEAGDLATSLAPHFGSRDHAAAVISHLSPRTSWSRNIAGAVAMAHGDTSDTPEGCMSANVKRARQAILSEDPLNTFGKGAPKTKRFAANIAGDRESVTVDVWAARVAGVTEQDLSKVGVYDALEAAYQAAARRRGVDPTTMQATTWIVQRNGRHA